MEEKLAKYGIQIISGLARGVDIKSQSGAMSVVNGKTFGVLGCGIDIYYLNSISGEYMKMQERDGLIQSMLREYFRQLVISREEIV